MRIYLSRSQPNINSDSGDIGQGASVAGLVGEAVRAAKAGVRSVGEGAVGIQYERSVGGTVDQLGRQRIAA